MKKIHISFYDEVYRVYYEIFFGYDTIKEAKKEKVYAKEFLDILDDDSGEFYQNCSGMFVTDTISNKKNNAKVNFIFVKSGKKNTMLKTFVHETMHATISTMTHSGVKINREDTGEAYCFYQEMLMDKLLEKMV